VNGQPAAYSVEFNLVTRTIAPEVIAMIDSEPDAAASASPSRHAGGTSSPAVASADAAFWADAPHSIASYEAFLRDLPELLQTHAGWCVAYANGIRLGIARRRCREFYEKLNAIDCDPSQILVFTIEPQRPPQQVEIGLLEVLDDSQ
jgi:hypothetical protein